MTSRPPASASGSWRHTAPPRAVLLPGDRNRAIHRGQALRRQPDDARGVGERSVSRCPWMLGQDEFP
jgi:hypothetical protein